MTCMRSYPVDAALVKRKSRLYCTFWTLMLSYAWPASKTLMVGEFKSQWQHLHFLSQFLCSFFIILEMSPATVARLLMPHPPTVDKYRKRRALETALSWGRAGNFWKEMMFLMQECVIMTTKDWNFVPTFPLDSRITN
eukprot:5071336-Karenia_brevis.AAC.1